MAPRHALVLVLLLFSAGVRAENLDSEIVSRIQRVEPFRFLRAEAEKLGVRVWLFGGTAAAYAHYVKWDLQRENGDSRFQADRFDYDYTNIYRSTQDLDIVIDGTAAQAEKLEALLKTTFPHLQGSKTDWEVRLLKGERQGKEKLLGNPDFSNQHTDSHSTGMIEVTTPPRGEMAIRDLRDWKGRKPAFLEDVRRGALHYYFSDKHETTKRFREGKNPPIFSAIRYLIKAFQFELKLDGEDLARIKQVIDRFDEKKDLADPYARQWVIKNAKKLFQNSVDVEYAWNTLERLGLRKKLAGLESRNTPKSLGWWMEKEPLRSAPLGTEGRTAAELGVTVVAHETSDFLAYESITRSHKGTPNVFISREKSAGEAAAWGNGFYTAVGRKGMRGTGLTIRFTVDPLAREGQDFKLISVGNGSMVVFNNRSALTIIPESPNIGPIEYLQLVGNLDKSDRGILEKLRRRVGIHLRNLDAKETVELNAFLTKTFKRPDSPKRELVLREWLALENSTAHDAVLAGLLESRMPPARLTKLFSLAFKNSHWIRSPRGAELLTRLLDRLPAGELPEEAFELLAHVEWAAHPEGGRLLSQLAKKMGDSPRVERLLLRRVLTNPGWAAKEEAVSLVAEIARRGRSDEDLLNHVLDKPDAWETLDRKALLREIAERGNAPLALLRHPSIRQGTAFGWQLVEIIADRGNADGAVAKLVLSQEGYAKRPGAGALLRRLVDRGRADREIATDVLGKKFWVSTPDGMYALARLNERGNARVDRELVTHVLTSDGWKNNQRYLALVDDLIERGNADGLFVDRVMDSRGFDYRLRPKEMEYLTKIIRRGKANKEVLSFLSGAYSFATSAWWRRDVVVDTLEEFIRAAGEKELRELVKQVLVGTFLVSHPRGTEILLAVIERGLVNRLVAKEVLSGKGWAKHPDIEKLRKALGPDAPGCRGDIARLHRR